MLKENDTVRHIYSPSQHQSNIKPAFGPLWRKETFNSDVRHVYNSDVVVALVDFNKNGSCDDGIAFEMGAAFTANVPIVIVRVHNDESINLMIAESGVAYLDNIQDLSTYDFDELEPNSCDNEVI